MLRFGMVGGGPGAFIGKVHLMAASLDGQAQLVAGVFSSDPAKSKTRGHKLGLDPTRIYETYQEMAQAEAAREDGIDFVVIVTPNHLHFDIACVFLEAEFHVVCDKPLTTTLEDAEELCRMVAEGRSVFVVTHNYTGYPMIKEARQVVREGRLGRVRRIQVEYVQGWLSTPLEQTGQRQAAWRTNPTQAGSAGALGDIGTHAHNLARYVTGLEVEELYADLTTFVEGRELDDDASLLLRWSDGARGTLTASQIAYGEENGLTLRVYGTEGSIAWRQEEPETLVLKNNEITTISRRGTAGLGEMAQHCSRLPPGHPEGFIEGFANLYQNAVRTIAAQKAGGHPSTADLDFPTVWDGARGVHFIERALESTRLGGWVDARYTPPQEPPQ
jgi:predicted dehydrogenase